MPNESIYQIAAGETTEDQVYRMQVLRELLYKQSGNLSVGTQVVDETTFDVLDVQFSHPGEMTADYPVQQDAVTNRQRIDWQEFDMSLQRGQTRYFMADSAKLRGVGNIQQDRSQRRAAEAMARRKDENILETLNDGATAENTDTAANAWNSDNADVVEYLYEMWTDILTTAPINNANINNFAVLMPIEIWTELNQVELINNVQQQIRNYLGQTFGFSMYPTKLGYNDDDQFDHRDTVTMLIPGDETAIHGVLSEDAASSAGVPLVEEERVTGRGEEYMISQWFNTSILEHESGSSGESPRIAVRNDVNTNV